MVFALTGCAVHPLPENVEGFNTVQIVDRVRCEARTALQDEVIRRLYASGDPILAQELRDHREEFQNFDVRRLKTQREQHFYNRYIDSAIAYGFTFDITEDNLDSSEVDLLKAISGGTVSLNLKASSDRMRNSHRTLVVVDRFKELLDDLQVCQVPRYQPDFAVDSRGEPNLVYPIAGAVGLGEVVQTFVQLNQEGLLAGKDAAGKDLPDKAPVLTDTLMFTTTLTGSANPQVMLNPVGHNVDLKLATLTDQATRKDLNMLSVALSLHPKAGYERPYSVAPFLAGGAATFARRDIGSAAQRAVDALTQQKIDIFLDRFSRIAIQ